MLHQAEDVMDVLRVVAPPRLYQYIPYYDNSSIHNKSADLTLSASKTNCKWGGKQVGIRASKIIPGCIGPNPALMWCLPGQGTGEWEGGPKWVTEHTAGAVTIDITLKVGDIDYGVYQEDDPPPFYDLKARRHDRPMTAREIVCERSRFVFIRQYNLTTLSTSCMHITQAITTV